MITNKKKQLLNLLDQDVKNKIDASLKKFPTDKKRSALLDSLMFAQESNNGYLTNDLIESVAVSAIGPCMLPVDKDVNPLYSGVLYGIDTRAKEEINYINRIIGEDEIFEFGGNTLTSQSIGPKILWLKNNYPEIYKKSDKIVTNLYPNSIISLA